MYSLLGTMLYLCLLIVEAGDILKASLLICPIPELGRLSTPGSWYGCDPRASLYPYTVSLHGGFMVTDFLYGGSGL